MTHRNHYFPPHVLLLFISLIISKSTIHAVFISCVAACLIWMPCVVVSLSVLMWCRSCQLTLNQLYDNGLPTHTCFHWLSMKMRRRILSTSNDKLLSFGFTNFMWNFHETTRMLVIILSIASMFWQAQSRFHNLM